MSLPAQCNDPIMSGSLGQPNGWEGPALITFGERVRQLRNAKGFSLRQLAPKVGVGFTYLSRVETGKMTYGDYPSDALIHRIAEELDGDEDQLLLLAERIPEKIKRRVLERPEAFRMLANLSNGRLTQLLKLVADSDASSKRLKSS
jgi:transcriptional regulator with XRE-family HTH domain